MNQLKKQISEKEETTSKPPTNLLAFNGFSQLRKLLKGLVLLTLILTVSFIATALVELSSSASGNAYGKEKLISEQNESAYISSVRAHSEIKLIQEVDIYMKSIAPTTKLKADILVPLCEKYHMNVSFVLAQAILESHLGTRGLATKTNSVWNVGSFDNGKIHYTYKGVNESIEPYLKLLREKYLTCVSVKGDTICREIKNLIQDRGFVNSEGYRYATSAIYESSLRNMMIKINMESNIDLYQGISDLSNKDILGFFVPNTPVDSVFTAKL